VPDVPRVAVEAATLLGWERVIGIDGLFIGMTGFGASAPAETLKTHFGFDAETIAERISAWLEIQNADREER
jgi:transketolase